MMRPESATVLADELDETEKELFDARAQLFEEVRLCKVLTDELVATERDLAALNDAFWGNQATHYAIECRSRDRIDALEAKAFVEAKRARWLPAALAVAAALGGYVGFLLGVAS